MSFEPHRYDIIVIGGGHAGCEAALAAARMGCETLLLSIDIDRIAAMPCSPSIGGIAKGQIVRDIDALGGEMGRVADRSAIQYRTLNTSKGPAVQSTRTQNDKWRYHTAMKKVLEHQPRLHLRQTVVDSLIVDRNRVAGVRDSTGFAFEAPAVVIATGTFLSGLIHIGESTVPAGRAGEFASYGLAQDLRKAGFELGRMKTGTPARLRRSSIDFGRFTEQPGDPEPRPFSLSTTSIELPQVSCFMGTTNERVHDIVRRNLEQSALYSGRITGVPARYCPSFEDKIVRFPDRDRHPLILEPEGLDSEEIYLSGLGNSLPVDIQIELVRSVEGLEAAEITRPAYAIEYDFVNPLQLRATLETKRVDGLFLAGQINGTSGYEEAAGQGFWAGVNAALQVQKRPPFVPDRS
ncbi:MAG: tRNA uridine-5-carboxymethylaminomethyl(34) synthesis enzyme MnmG, partial [Chitinivibrionales bacterium]|nr:tRNA uridine-5-carboxymethylaminomethyl(34) synthesis enzyme MnmG [Chitinivibrionales bacterium]